MGTAPDGGSSSATNRRNTVNESKTVIPRLIFSPDSAGRKKLSKVTADIKLQYTKIGRIVHSYKNYGGYKLIDLGRVFILFSFVILFYLF